MTEFLPWVQMGMFGLAALAIAGNLKGNWVAGIHYRELQAKNKELEAEVAKWQDRTFEAVRAAKTVAVASTEAIRSQRDVAT